jgi:hypothetical protein
MISLAALWLPILLSAVFVFIMSSIIHMALPWHRADFPKLANEDQVMDALRPLALPPGDYAVPKPSSMKEMSSPEFADKLKRGPVLMLTVRSGATAMGKSLLLWFVYSLVVGLFSAYVAANTLPPGTHYLKVFQIVGTVAFTGYALALCQSSIWYSRNWITTIRSMIDGLVYALLTAGTFGWLWPH